MKSAIEQLILENGAYMEDMRTTETYDNLLSECDKICKQLKATLTPEQAELLDELIYKNMGLEAEATDRFFVHGFKTGIKLIIECL